MRRRPITVRGAIAEGLRRVVRWPGLLLMLWLVNLLFALPVALGVARSIERSLGASLVADRLRSGFDMEWYGVYAAEARGLETTFRPTVLGVGAFLDNLEGWATGGPAGALAALALLAALYGLVWLLLLGGVVERYANPAGPHSAQRLLGAGGRFYFRFLRLAAASGVLYLSIYALHRWLYGKLEYWTRDVTVERDVLLASLAVVGLTALLLVLVHMAATFAKVATVTEDRRSMLLALLAGLRFVLRRPLSVLGLYLGLALVSGVLLAVYHLLAPTAGPGTAVGVALAFLLAQGLLIVRLGLRLALLGGAISLYRAYSTRARRIVSPTSIRSTTSSPEVTSPNTV